jgi:hypothetical protein
MPPTGSFGGPVPAGARSLFGACAVPTGGAYVVREFDRLRIARLTRRRRGRLGVLCVRFTRLGGKVVVGESRGRRERGECETNRAEAANNHGLHRHPSLDGLFPVIVELEFANNSLSGIAGGDWTGKISLRRPGQSA